MLQLLLPALIPSWRFFDRIGPAPRIEFATTAARDERAPQWREVRPRPDHASAGKMLARLFWNRRRNEALYLVSCAERLVDDPTEWRARELWSRVADILREEQGTARGRQSAAGTTRLASGGWLRVRIVESMREGSRVVADVIYESDAQPFDAAVGEVSA